MIPVRLYPREHVEHVLHKMGCVPVDVTTLKTASIWKTPWGHHFIVPEEGPDKRCNERRFTAILEEIERTRPPHQ